MIPKRLSREVLEETGYTISEPKLIYKYNPSNGISDQIIAVYKAIAIKKEGQFDTIEVMSTQWVAKEKVIEMTFFLPII